MISKIKLTSIHGKGSFGMPHLIVLRTRLMHRPDVFAVHVEHADENASIIATITHDEIENLDQVCLEIFRLEYNLENITAEFMEIEDQS